MAQVQVQVPVQPEVCPPSGTDLQNAALIATKITENLPLTELEKEKLLPSMRSWDTFTLQEFMGWESDKFKIFGPEPVFHEFRLMEDGSSLSLLPLFYSPDPQTTYCIVTNGYDSGVLMVYEHNEWYIIACVGVYGIMSRLEQTGFLPWDQFVLCKHEPVQPAEAHSDDDYWDQYDNQQDEQEENEDPQGPTKKSDTRLYIKSHCHKSVKDLWPVYKDSGASIEQYANDWLAIMPNYRGSIPPTGVLGQYTQRVAQNELQLYEQVELGIDAFVADVELALLGLDFAILGNLGR